MDAKALDAKAAVAAAERKLRAAMPFPWQTADVAKLEGEIAEVADPDPTPNPNPNPNANPSPSAGRAPASRGAQALRARLLQGGTADVHP